MQKRNIGTLEVSPVGMGCMAFSHGYGQIPERSYSIEAIREAYDFGCTFFDTAEVYGDVLYYAGHNEQIVGEAVEPFRDEVVLATKLHLSDHEGDTDSQLETSIRAHLAKSLVNLRTDHVELYYLHRVNERIAVERVAAVMGKLIDEGLIGGWGLSQVGVPTIAAAQAVTPLAAVQNLYNMAERDCEAEVIPYLLEHNIGLVPFSPTASGLLTGKVTPQTKFAEKDDVRAWVPQLSGENLVANQPLIDLVSGFAERKGATAAQISMAWMLHKYPNVVPIPGSKNKGRIIENLGAWDVAFTDDEFAELERTLDATPVAGHRGIEESQGKGFRQKWEDQQQS